MLSWHPYTTTTMSYLCSSILTWNAPDLFDFNHNDNCVTISKTTFIPLYLRHFGTHDNLVARWWSTIFNEWPFNPHHFLGSEQYKHTTTWLLLLFNSRHINSNGHTTDISVHVALTTWLLGNKQHSSTIKTFVAGLAFGWYLDKKYHW